MFRPGRYYQDDPPEFESGVWFVIIVSLVHMLGYYLFVVLGAILVSQQQGVGVSELLGDLTTGAHIQGPFISILVLMVWAAMAGMLHIAVKLQHGKAYIRDTLTIVSLSTPATLLGLLIAGGGFLLALNGNITAMPYDILLGRVSHESIVASAIGGSVAFIWMGYVWLSALEAVHDVPRSNARRAVIVPVAVLVGSFILAV